MLQVMSHHIATSVVLYEPAFEVGLHDIIFVKVVIQLSRCSTKLVVGQ